MSSVDPSRAGAVPPPAPAGAFAPLRQPVFAVLWGAMVLGNTGSFMRDVASAWVITDLSASPAAVALVQTAASLPVFLLALPAGVLSDILDRRRFLMLVQAAMALVSAVLMLLAGTGTLTVETLIGLTFLSGIGAALVGPAWQSIVPELVPREQLRGAAALNSLGVNVSRAIGPALGGIVVAALGAATAYAADAASYLVVIAALWWWRRPAKAPDALSENFLGAFRAGLRYTRASGDLKRVLLRAGVFFAFASALWGLLPLVAREVLGGDAGFYGLLLGAVGAGAIGGALALPGLRARLGTDGLMLAAALSVSLVMAALPLVPPPAVAVALMLLLGAGWIAALTTLNGTAQAILPNWVRGRGLAVYLMVFSGASAAGSLAWGGVAQALGVPAALWIAAAGGALAALALYRLKLPAGESDLEAARHWPDAEMVHAAPAERGPVMVQVEYRIRPAERAEFLAVLRRLGEARRRDGAFAWGVFEHTADAGRVVEWFLVESWAEHQRQHRRVTRADAGVQAELLRFHTGEGKPAVGHWIALD
ncbi:MFS transporter [Azohydromonas aeria]|uniref:MFS transporter n=1 Tax=Azohydromonas aeria TaxID=2590212 RepID=UPI0012F9D875|nr:MFS transporter [Azohydromonas aeria]